MVGGVVASLIDRCVTIAYLLTYLVGVGGGQFVSKTFSCVEMAELMPS
jgi:hypothetical protein